MTDDYFQPQEKPHKLFFFLEKNNLKLDMVIYSQSWGRICLIYVCA